MRRGLDAATTWAIIGLAVGLTLGACGGGGGGSQSTGGSTGSTGTGGTTGNLAPAPDPTCGPVAPATLVSQGQIDHPGVFVPASTREVAGRAHTNHLVNVTSLGRGPGPQGYTPAQIRKAYGVPDGLGQGAIAIVDAYHYPTALHDFNVFSNQFGLPVEPSTTATLGTNGRFQVVYATGSQPATDTSWAQESALDTQWAHAMAPNAKIFLVEARSSGLSDLMAAVQVAVGLPGVTQVSLSFGSTETACSYARYDQLFRTPGVTFFAASGDTSTEKDFPALSRDVVCVGGTRLALLADGSRVGESVWAATAGSLSSFSPRPPYQDGVIGKSSPYRSGNDIAAVADPDTGVSVYDSTPDGHLSGWLIFGGTSTSTPIIAGIANAANRARSGSRGQNAALYDALGTSAFLDLTTGRSGSNAATVGWDMPSGVGTPNGLGGF